MTDEGVSCSGSQQSSTPSPETTTPTTNTYYVIPVVSAVTCSVLLVVMIVILVLVAKRMCKSPAYAHDEELLLSATEDLQTTVSMHSSSNTSSYDQMVP